MSFWLGIAKSLGIVAANKVVEEVTDTVTKEVNKRFTTNTPRDLTKFTKSQLQHLDAVYTHSKHGVHTYKDLMQYGNKKYEINKSVSSYYRTLKQYRNLKGEG